MLTESDVTDGEGGIEPVVQRYVPTLKAREAEIKALLRAPMSIDVLPLFELQVASSAGIDPVTGVARRSKGSATDAAYFIDDIARLWGAPLYVDITRVASGDAERHTWWRLLDVLGGMAPVALELIPVLLPTDTAAVLRAAAGVVGTTHRAALRIDMTRARTAPGKLIGLTVRIAAELRMSATSIDVILDWADSLEAYPLDELERDTIAVIQALGGQHGELVTIGTPKSDRFVQVGDWHPVRREWWLWLRLIAAGYDVTYGDYALYPPSSPVPVSPNYGHLRYSSGEFMHVHRRAQPRTGGGLAGAFAECCTHVVSQPYWLGAGFSGADRRIDDISNNSDKESQAGKWRQIATEHHFALVATQLASPPAAPLPGTA